MSADVPIAIFNTKKDLINSSSGHNINQFVDVFFEARRANEDEDFYQEEYRSWSRVTISTSLSFQIVCFTVMVGLCSLLGTLGNLPVLMVYSARKDRRTSNTFIKVLAIIDLVVCAVIMPYTVVLELHLVTSDVVCRLLEVLRHLSITASNLTLVAISFERYLAVCLIAHRLSIQNVNLGMIVVGVISVVTALPSLAIFAVVTKEEVQNVTCAFPHNFPPDFRFCHFTTILVGPVLSVAYQAFLMVFFFLSFLIIVVLYAFVYATLWQRSKRRYGGRCRNYRSEADMSSVVSVSRDDPDRPDNAEVFTSSTIDNVQLKRALTRQLGERDNKSKTHYVAALQLLEDERYVALPFSDDGDCRASQPSAPLQRLTERHQTSRLLRQSRFYHSGDIPKEELGGRGVTSPERRQLTSSGLIVSGCCLKKAVSIKDFRVNEFLSGQCEKGQINWTLPTSHSWKESAGGGGQSERRERVEVEDDIEVIHMDFISPTAKPCPVTFVAQQQTEVAGARPDSTTTPTKGLPSEARPARRVRHRRTARMLFLCSVVFLVTWLPFWVDVFSNGHNLLLRYLFFVGNASNPLVYGITNSQFRKSFLLMVCRLRGWGLGEWARTRCPRPKDILQASRRSGS